MRACHCCGAAGRSLHSPHSLYYPYWHPHYGERIKDLLSGLIWAVFCRFVLGKSYDETDTQIYLTPELWGIVLYGIFISVKQDKKLCWNFFSDIRFSIMIGPLSRANGKLKVIDPNRRNILTLTDWQPNTWNVCLLSQISWALSILPDFPPCKGSSRFFPSQDFPPNEVIIFENHRNIFALVETQSCPSPFLHGGAGALWCLMMPYDDPGLLKMATIMQKMSIQDFGHTHALLYFFAQTVVADIRYSEQGPGINIQNKQSSRPERSKQGWLRCLRIPHHDESTW